MHLGRTQFFNTLGGIAQCGAPLRQRWVMQSPARLGGQTLGILRILPNIADVNERMQLSKRFHFIVGEP